MKIAVIGAGVSGLSIARILNKNHEVIVFESDSRPGGMIKCDRVEGHLFHRIGGHVFNTKRKDVLDWFWNIFNCETEFTKTLRNSSVFLNNKMIPYPIENHAYLLEDNLLKSFIKDLLILVKSEGNQPSNFEEFLRGRFGETLYNLYFQPYNYKVWRRDLSKVPLSWLEGKLPMPTVEEMIYNNINHVEEREFVHSSFYYPLEGGSQFLANRLAEELNIHYNTAISQIVRRGKKWEINGGMFDKVIFCGNIKHLNHLIVSDIDLSAWDIPIAQLEYHGTTAVFCEIEINPYSWIYMPSRDHESHRIICTGNFAASNNVENKMTGTIEFTDEYSKEEIICNLDKIPYSPRYLTHHYEQYTYPIQNKDSREMITSLKQKLEHEGIYLLGRFAEWEYYNMDIAMGAALDLGKKFTNY